MDQYHQQDKPSFFTIIVEGHNTNSLKVPKMMLFNLGEVFWNNASIFLIGSSGEKWQVSILKKENGIYFQNIGWKKFLNDNSVKLEELLVFTYNRENSFKVQIFGKNGLERPSYKKQQEDEAARQNNEQQEVAAPIVDMRTRSSLRENPAHDSVCVKKENEEAAVTMLVKRRRGRPRKNASPEICVKKKEASAATMVDDRPPRTNIVCLERVCFMKKEAECAATMVANGMKDRPIKNDFPERVWFSKKEAETSPTVVAKGMKDKPRNNASNKKVCGKKKEAESVATMVAKGIKGRGRPRRSSAPAVIIIDSD